MRKIDAEIAQASAAAGSVREMNQQLLWTTQSQEPGFQLLCSRVSDQEPMSEHCFLLPILKKPGLEPGILIMGCGIPADILTARPNSHPRNT